MATSDFWRDMAAQFRAIDPARMLRADWSKEQTTEDVPPIVSEYWRLSGADQRTTLEFDSLARRAGVEITLEINALDAWLNALKHERANVSIPQPRHKTADDGRIISISSLAIITQVTEASADFCKVMESRSLETERIAKLEAQQKANPANWSFLRRQLEAMRAMKTLATGPHEEIHEEVVRRLLAQQYGIAPEAVTWNQIQFEVAGLLSEYPAIRVVPSQPSKDELPITKKASERAEPTCAQLERLRTEAHIDVEDLADKVGIEPRSVYRHLSGESLPQPRALRAYQKIFSELLDTKIVITKMSGKCQ